MTGHLFRRIIPKRHQTSRSLLWTVIVLLAVLFLIMYLNGVSLGM
jgi:hypothetical protein